jgi:hypothetical protein
MPYKDPEKQRAAQRRYEKKRVRPPERKAYLKEYMKEYEKKTEVKLKRKAYRKEYEKRPERKVYHKEYRNKVENKKRKYQLRKNNPAGKRGRYLRKKVRQAVIHQRCYISTIHKLIGCDVPNARAHLEAQFKPWMTWENYGCGKGKWTIDHIIRVASIDIFDEDEVKRIFHYSNMRPLCFIKNSENTDEGRGLL